MGGRGAKNFPYPRSRLHADAVLTLTTAAPMWVGIETHHRAAHQLRASQVRFFNPIPLSMLLNGGFNRHVHALVVTQRGAGCEPFEPATVRVRQAVDRGVTVLSTDRADTVDSEVEIAALFNLADPFRHRLRRFLGRPLSLAARLPLLRIHR